jgi:hypothetical protein
MRRKRALTIILGLIVVVCAYCAYSLRCFYLAPPLELPEDLHGDPRSAIEGWYEGSDDIPSPKISMNGVLYALTHPYDPHKSRCAMDLNNKGIIQVYCDVRGGYLATFVFEDGRWKFVGSFYTNDLLKILKNRANKSLHPTANRPRNFFSVKVASDFC